MRGDFLALGAVGTLALAGASRGARNEQTAPEEAMRHIREKLLGDSTFTLVEDWTRVDPYGIRTMTVSYDKAYAGGFQEAVSLLQELGFEEQISNKAFKKRTSTRIYLTAGLGTQISLHKTNGRPWVEVDFSDSLPRTLLSGQDVGCWGYVKNKGLLTFWGLKAYDER